MERISRKDDRRVYQPRVHADLIHRLYLLKCSNGLPMTTLLAEALTKYLDEAEDQAGRVQPQA